MRMAFPPVVSELRQMIVARFAHIPSPPARVPKETRTSPVPAHETIVISYYDMQIEMTIFHESYHLIRFNHTKKRLKKQYKSAGTSSKFTQYSCCAAPLWACRRGGGERRADAKEGKSKARRPFASARCAVISACAIAAEHAIIMYRSSEDGHSSLGLSSVRRDCAKAA